MRTAELSLVAEARSAGVARRFLSEMLVTWDAEGYSDTATLLLSELVTNATLHAGTDIRVRVCLTPTGLRLEVADGSDRRPIVRHYSAQATTGRGLGMVESLAQSWGVVPQASGKTVWAELVDDGSRALRRPDRDVVPDLADFPDLDDESADPTSSSGPAARRSCDMMGWAA